MPPPSHPVDKRHDGLVSPRYRGAETDISFGQISLIAWPLNAAAEDASGLREN